MSIITKLNPTALTNANAGNNVTIDNETGKISTRQFISITYTELKTLRDTSKLIPGQWYRITDYITTINSSISYAKVVDTPNLFDLAILATDVDKLNENCFAVNHNDDIYFNSSNLNAWKINYTIDNDVNKYSWADDVNGKGVIYRMIDEYGNDCPYDFKNILFKRDIAWFNEHKSWCEDVLHSIPTTDMWFYTFSWLDDNINTLQDLSLNLDNCICENNIIKSAHDFENLDIIKFGLNNNIFINYLENGCIGNILEEDCVFNTFGYWISINKFGNQCINNTFSNQCVLNTFSNQCVNNTFSNQCMLNTFGNQCHSNTFGNNYNSNTFGNDCSSNTFGDSCSSNTLGNGCQYNTFGNNCYSNTFGNNCNYINLNTPDDSNINLRYIKVTSGVSSTYSSNKLDLTDIPRGLDYQTTVAKNSQGGLIKYCEADLYNIISQLAPSFSNDFNNDFTIKK